LVFPELQPDLHGQSFEHGQLSSGVPELDEMLHGGIERGTVTIISGSTGVGKTTLGTQFMKEGAGRGDHSVLYLFEESKHTFFKRAESVNIPVERMQEQGTLEIVEIEPASITPQEFAHHVRDQVENKGADMVMVDGIAGYRLSLLGREDELAKHVHALGRYLKNMGVTTILIEELKNITGTFEATDQNTSYLADNLLFLRHIELDGELKKTVGMLKKRTSDYGRQLREFQITEHGIKVGEPMTDVRGILEGTPERVSNDDD
jgi:circadian clock protein KaiC